MALQFIFGSSGSGKSHSLYKKIIEEAAKHPERNYIVLVPEQFSMQTQKDLVEASPDHAIMNIDILSFGRLAYRVMEETGGNQKIVLDDEGKNLILRKIAGDYEDELTILRGNLKRQGYISEVKSVISEFAQYDIREEQIDAMMEQAGVGTSLYYKLSDLKKVYQGFYAYLEENYITREEILDLLCERVPKSAILKDSVLALDGFTGFTPVQNRLLAELLRVCRDVKVTVTIPGSEDPYLYQGPYELFALSKEMTSRLLLICREQKIQVKDPVWMDGKVPYRFRKNEPMAFLESHLFRYQKDRYEKKQDRIHILHASSPGDEVEAAARQVRHLVRTKGWRYRDFAVIVPDLSAYSDEIRTRFSQYGIPVFMDQKRSVLLNPFVEYVRSVLAMIQKGFTYESVFRFLRTGLFEFTMEEVDTLENYVLALGIRGYKRWQESWIRKSAGMSEEELVEVNCLRIRFVEQMESLVLVLQKRRKSVRDITEALYDFLVHEEMYRKVREQQMFFEQNGQLALAKEYSQVYRIVIDLFDKFVELLGEETVSLKEYGALLDAGLEEARVGIIPPGTDEVMAGDVERTRLKEIKALFFLGANDTFLPGQLGLGGLLSETDREKIRSGGTKLSAGGKEQAYVQKFYLYMMLTKPEEELYLSFASASGDGAQLRPAYLIRDIKKLFPQISVKREEERTLRETELTNKNSLELLIRGLQNEDTERPEWMELCAWYRRDPARRKKLEEVLETFFYRMPDDRLSKEAAKILYEEGIDRGVTRLERYASCAFAHFLAYGLRLRERQEYEFKPLDWGNLFHRAMEHFARKAEILSVPVTEITDEMRRNLVEESVEESIVDYENTILYSTKRREYLITRMKRLVDRTVWALLRQQKMGDFIQTGTEVCFDGGKIDRIDTCEEENQVYVKVTDYKTGSKAFDMTAFYYGLQLQLAVYLNAALELEKKKHPNKEIIPAGIFYYQMKDPMVEKTEEDQVQDALLKELRPSGLVSSDPEVLNHLDHTGTRSSLAAPFARNKDGSISKTSRAASRKEFELLSSYTRKKTGQLKEEILEGNAKKEPYELGTSTGCDYCPYHGICGFDEKIEGCGYRNLVSQKREEIFRLIARELSEWEGE